MTVSRETQHLAVALFLGCLAEVTGRDGQSVERLAQRMNLDQLEAVRSAAVHLESVAGDQQSFLRSRVARPVVDVDAPLWVPASAPLFSLNRQPVRFEPAEPAARWRRWLSRG